MTQIVVYPNLFDMGYHNFYYFGLIGHVGQCSQGALGVLTLHQVWSKHNTQVTLGHQVFLLVCSNPGGRELRTNESINVLVHNTGNIIMMIKAQEYDSRYAMMYVQF